MNCKKFNVPLLIILCAFLFMLKVTWMKWGGFLVDGVDYWVPEQIVKGSVLHRDLCWPTLGIFPSYFIALFYKIFGIGKLSYVACTLLITAGVTFFTYRIARLFLDKKISTLVAVTFICVFAFGYYGLDLMNFIIPFNYDMIFFVCFALAAVFYFCRFIFSENKKHLWSWCLFMVLSFCCRPMMSLLTWGTFFILGQLFAIMNKRGESKGLRLALFLPALFAAFVYFLFLSVTHSLQGFGGELSMMSEYVRSSEICRLFLGVPQLTQNILLICLSFLAHLLVIGVIAFCARLVQLDLIRKGRFRFIDIFGIAVFIAVLFIIQSKIILLFQYRALPIILLEGIVYYFIRLKKDIKFKESFALLVLFTISLSFISRIFFLTIPHFYGFCLLVPALICYYIFFFHIIAPKAQKIFKPSEELFKMMLIVFFAVSIVPYLRVSRDNYESKNVKLEAGERGTFYFHDPKAVNRLNGLLAYLRESTDPDEALFVLPEGVILNYLLERKQPIRYHIYLPFTSQFLSEKGRILKQDIDRYNIETIVIVSRDTAEYGKEWFGIGYGQELYFWIKKNYRLVKQFGPAEFSEEEFTALVYRRINNE